WRPVYGPDYWKERQTAGQCSQPNAPRQVVPGAQAATGESQQAERTIAMATNQERAQRFSLAAMHYTGDAHTNTIDLLADCLHWCDQHGHDFEELLRVAQNHFTAECDQEKQGAPLTPKLSEPTFEPDTEPEMGP